MRSVVCFICQKHIIVDCVEVVVAPSYQTPLQKGAGGEVQTLDHRDTKTAFPVGVAVGAELPQVLCCVGSFGKRVPRVLQLPLSLGSVRPCSSGEVWTGNG